MGALITLVKYTLWPLLLATCIAGVAYGFSVGHPIIAFNITYFLLIATLVILERIIPFEPAWLEDDAQTLTNILHTLSSKATVQALLAFSGLLGLTTLITPLVEPGVGIWPRGWPLWVQVPLGLIFAEFMLYWVHRLAHEFDTLWRFHSIHHSATRLWVINTGRFHLLDSVLKVGAATTLLVILGAPLEVVMWISVITAFIGLMTHCNVDMFCGPLSYIFSTPNLHRWHHSRDVLEGNKNYGENLIIWDLIFGTWYLPKDRRPPRDIGIDDPMPPRFLDQLAFPFRREHYRTLKKD